jgi:two-component system, response regulator PdtaR
LALVDIDLGGTIDGISVAAELAPLGVPIIFITGDYKKASVEGRELAADILIKPVTHSTVLHVVASILQGKQGTNTVRAALPVS